MTPISYDALARKSQPQGKVEQNPMIPFGEYIFRRLISIGSKSIFGCPGDFNMPLLEHLYAPAVKDNGLQWFGTCNELNGAYAADGYSRYCNKIGVLITTYGVGEVSAMNGVAGAFAENVKLLHIVGVASSSDSQNQGLKNRNLHHLVQQMHDSNFKGPNHKIYHDMVKDRIACSAEYLEDIDTACDKVDQVISDIFENSKPGYLFVPVDFADKLVSVNNLITRPSIKLHDCIQIPEYNQLHQITQKILQWFYNSKTPGVVGDVLTDRYDASGMLNDLIEATNVWNFSTFMGKSIIDESNSTFMGQYIGAECPKSIFERFLQCDLVLHFGIDNNEINTGHYSFQYGPNTKVIEFHPEYIRFFECQTQQEQIFKGVNFVPVMNEFLTNLDVSKLSFQYDPSVGKYSTAELSFPEENGSDEITQLHLQKVVPASLNAGDVVCCDTGSFQFAVRDFIFPSQLKYVSQSFFLSIGYALPATLGVGAAMREYPRCHIRGNVSPDYKPRLILFEGDGAAQMTIQEMSSLLRYNINVEIYLWNNNGYTIERAILGPTRSYNDIMAWNWTKMFEAFGDTNQKYTKSSITDSRFKFDLKLKEMKNSKVREGLELVEVKLDAFDYPEQLKCMVRAIEAGQAKKQKA